MKIAILGYGTVGRGTYDIIQARQKDFESLGGIQVAKVLMLEKEVDQCGLDPDLICTDYQEILEDDTITCVVEVTGAKDQGFLFMKEAIERKKHLVTANKAVVSQHLEELTSLANRYGVHFLYEAAVGGGIPLISPLKAQAKINTIDSIEGIFNGTCNYILSKMLDQGLPYGETLKRAQDLGYAEADPTDDVEGFDTLRKLVIVASLALGFPVLEEDVALEGISSIKVSDMDYLKDHDLKIKLLASFKKDGDDYGLIVEPALIGRNHPLYGIDGATNAASLHGNFVDQLTFIGPGAGKYPTGNAVVCDIMDLCRLKEEKINFTKRLKGSQNDIKAPYYVSLDSDQNLPKDWIDWEESVDGGKRIRTKEISRDALVGTIENLRKEGADIFFARIQ